MEDKPFVLSRPNIEIDIKRNAKGVWSLNSLRVGGPTVTETMLELRQAVEELKRDFGW